MSDLFQVTGVSSGIAWDEIINKILEKAKKPAEQWQKQIDTLEVKKTLYQELQSEFNKLRNTMTKLRLANAYNAKKAEYTSFSDNGVKPESIVTAKLSADTELTWWDLEVKEIARAQRHTTARFGSVSEALGISGAFNVRVGNQFATIKLEAADNLREINYKLAHAVDQNGSPLAVTAKIVDNRIVLESAKAGKNSSGDTRGVPFTMGSGKEYYLPHSSKRDDKTGKYTYPPQIFQLKYDEKNVDGSTYTYNYVEGRDFTYDASLGKITWLSTATIKPPLGATFEAIYSEYLTAPKNTTGSPQSLPAGGTLAVDQDMLPVLPTGQEYKDITTEGNFSIICNGKEYRQGWDFDVVTVTDTDGKKYQVVDWRSNLETRTYIDEDGNTQTYIPNTTPENMQPNGTGAEASYTVHIGANTKYAYDENVFYLEPAAWTTEWKKDLEQGATPSDYLLPKKYNASEYRASSDGKFEIQDSSNTYVSGVHFTVTPTVFNGETRYAITWNTTLVPTPPAMANCEVRAVVENDYSASSPLAQLGFITPGTTGTADKTVNDNWKFTDGSAIMASDAVFEIDGVEVTRPTNTIDDLITGVTFELRGLGKVRINVVRDLEKTVEDMDAFVESYNKVMDWINYYVSQKQDAANPVDEEDHLSSILQQSKGKTVFGALHGDQLLWSIKNQLRARLSNPISAVSSSLTSRKVLDTTAAMNVKSSFFLYVGGKAARVDVSASDSMDDIRKKIADAKNIASKDGKNPAGGTIGLNVTIRNGQLVIEGAKSSSLQYTSGNRETTRDTITRGTSGNSDYLNFIPVTAQPVSGELRVSSTNTLYTEGVDYRVITETDKNNVVSSKIEWMGARAPQPGAYYSVEYTYDSNAVYVAEIPGSGPTNNEVAAGQNGLSYLELRQDASKATLATMGITTESFNNGKSGLIEFDSEKFIATLESDPNISANAMVTFMRDFDTYIGNLVDSSQILVAGQPVTKGRISGALNKIDNEQKTLNDRITKLEKELETKQTALYKRYSDMEVAIQKLNAQMSSVAQYLNNTGK
jgi:flagellar capping protein FliD